MVSVSVAAPAAFEYVRVIVQVPPGGTAVVQVLPVIEEALPPPLARSGT
jgi:hypothetical protein